MTENVDWTFSLLTFLLASDLAYPAAAADNGDDDNDGDDDDDSFTDIRIIVSLPLWTKYQKLSRNTL